jgi:hypothetical protein
MLIVYGSRHYGKIDDHDGEFAVTRFAHIYFVPLIPLGSIWVTGEDEEGLRGHPVRFSGKSVLAGYARIWGPLLAVGGIASGGLVGIAGAAAAGGVTLWSWMWRSLRTARERRRSDFHLVAFGTRCDPLHMPRDLAEDLRAVVDRRWAEASEGRTPDDVARLGATHPMQAVLAYGSLRLAARTAPRAHARRAREASDRILDSITDADTEALRGGPYRSLT